MNVQCPYCGGEVVEGTVSVRGTLLGFLAFGFSHQHLWFRPCDGSGDEVIIRSAGQRAGHQCTQCGALVIQGDGG
jgi:predicted RNA-binding Zn-ribbon protein involved in translation (DUF1610 family)